MWVWSSILAWTRQRDSYLIKKKKKKWGRAPGGGWGCSSVVQNTLSYVRPWWDGFNPQHCIKKKIVIRELEPFFSPGGNGKQAVLGKVKQLPYDIEILLLSIHSKEINAQVHIKTCTWIFTTSLFIIAKKWKQSKIHQQTNRCIKCDIVTKWNSIPPQKGMKL